MLLTSLAMALGTVRAMEASLERATTLTITMEQRPSVKVATVWISAGEDTPLL